MSSKGRIEDDAAYENTLAWMVEKAELLDDPLTLAVEERNKLQRIYDFVEQRVLEYNRGQMLLADPGRLKLYKATGVAYQEFK
ncbi:hypothetical protein MKY14_16125 [Paenibacillus sp. FSL R5-0887]|uniref:hypothetical protein n=1 Tax=Paenibacillus sp. FSL R5-0887 TaxID=2921662 RepID=UPI0030F5A23E